MESFFIIAGVVVTIIGIIAIAIISGVYIAVKFFGIIITFGIIKDTKNNDQRRNKRIDP